MGTWVVARDQHGSERLVMSAHADSVNFIIGETAFLYFISAPYDVEQLRREVVRIIDGVFSGPLQVAGDGLRGSLTTASGEAVELVAPA